MLLIGSRAAKFHYPSFRKPKDYDFIATRQEVEAFLSRHKYVNNSSHDKKIRAKVFIDSRLIQFEFDIVDAYPSNLFLYTEDLNYGTYNDQLRMSYGVASPKSLFAIKKSHIIFPVHWHKNIIDYLYLKERVYPKSTNTLVDMDETTKFLFEMRREESIHKFKHKDRNFDVDNSDFFKKSEQFIKRKVEHDSIHRATCFYEEPLFLSCKKDTSKAEIDPELVDRLSFEDKIKLIQEEAMALALERFVIPALVKKEAYDAQGSYAKTAAKMVYNYLPDFLKDFAADNFDKVLLLPKYYVTEFIARHPTFKNDYLL